MVRKRPNLAPDMDLKPLEVEPKCASRKPQQRKKGGGGGAPESPLDKRGASGGARSEESLEAILTQLLPRLLRDMELTPVSVQASPQKRQATRVGAAKEDGASMYTQALTGVAPKSKAGSVGGGPQPQIGEEESETGGRQGQKGRGYESVSTGTLLKLRLPSLAAVVITCADPLKLAEAVLNLFKGLGDRGLEAQKGHHRGPYMRGKEPRGRREGRSSKREAGGGPRREGRCESVPPVEDRGVTCFGPGRLGYLKGGGRGSRRNRWMCPAGVPGGGGQKVPQRRGLLLGQVPGGCSKDAAGRSTCKSGVAELPGHAAPDETDAMLPVPGTKPHSGPVHEHDEPVEVLL
ncbi:protein SPT2 homolog [Mycetomoellerius zeteki]|uniref:protein SPT2 homolog n=1 Tax=Mycetomoellerius zeteki TaxID=64791 RepID=UPI00084ECD78|nr:PREDICTED: protein SPT2 homolog [Trachymyrmex zeteki]